MTNGGIYLHSECAEQFSSDTHWWDCCFESQRKYQMEMGPGMFVFCIRIFYTVALSSTLGAAILTFHCFYIFNDNKVILASTEYNNIIF